MSIGLKKHKALRKTRIRSLDAFEAFCSRQLDRASRRADESIQRYHQRLDEVQPPRWEEDSWAVETRN